jgi:hypothetical protein
MKTERAESDNHYIKNMVFQMERRLEEEQSHRVKSEDENRRAIDAKF